MSQIPDSPPEPTERLARDLAAVLQGQVDIPSDVDEAIRARIREQMMKARQTSGPFRWRVAGPIAVAASLLLVAGIAIMVRQPRRIHGPMTATPADPTFVTGGDVDGNGRVDILDAFTLARWIERGDHPLDPSLDRNGDGRVGAADVDDIALHAVSLSQETS